MPTTRHRYTITETDEVARALAEAARRWPEEDRKPGRLLLHLVEEGRRSLLKQREDVVAADREVIEQTSGVLTGVYPPGYLAELRADWPE
jgi:hypothetical protein